MKITLDIRNIDNLDLSEVDLREYEEIITALITSGGLSGVKGGQTIIHFDQDAVFMGVQLSYWPWRRRKKLP